MKRSISALFMAATLLPGIAAAQIKTLPGESLTVTATIEAIERSTRTVTLKGPQGNTLTTVVPKDVKRFDEMKVGDRLDITWTEAVLVSFDMVKSK
jgi:hypothetical protein